MSIQNLSVSQQNLLTVQEVADILRVSRSTVWRWCRDGTLPSAVKVGRNWRIRQHELERVMHIKI
ncbi:MAG: helix-turn-helix domain-containing protein [Chloroflexota bacterium]